MSLRNMKFSKVNKANYPPLQRAIVHFQELNGKSNPPEKERVGFISSTLTSLDTSIDPQETFRSSQWTLVGHRRAESGTRTLALPTRTAHCSPMAFWALPVPKTDVILFAK